LIVSTFILGSLTIIFLADYVPFMRSMPLTSRIAVAILGGAILVARSPSSAIAIVNELRARGNFTRTALGVTVIMDVVVIVLFAMSSSAADALITDLAFNIGFIGLLLLELLASLALGYLLYRILLVVFASRLGHMLKGALVLGLGYSIFLISKNLRHFTHDHYSFEILLEPLLVCMIAGFLISSFSKYRAEFASIVEDFGPAIYVLFFTLTGASLAIDILLQTWPITVALFAVRLAGIFLGSFSGGIIAGDPMRHNRISWMAYVTQAGVGLGLAKEVAVEFPDWGAAFATIIISVIVVNQIVGPPLFKWAIQQVGEAHPRAQTPEFDGVNDAIIFGLTAESVTLAHRLIRHNWQVKLACTRKSEMEELE
jgi:Kef-type K+ transport system membrane component KefB